MVKAKYNTVGSWIIFSILLMLVILLLGLLIDRFCSLPIVFFAKAGNKNFLPNIITLGFLIMFFLSFLFFFIKKITIDTTGKTVSFKNILTRQNQEYRFTDFDGFARTNLSRGYADYITIILVKDNKAVRYIDSFWVSNTDEMEQALHELPYLGSYRFGMWQQLRLLLRKPVVIY